MNLVIALIGLLMAFFGRALYWLLVGAAGFVAGAELAASYLPDQKPIVILLIALAAGVVGAVLAVVLQRLAFALAGFVTAGYLGIFAAHGLGIGDQNAIAAAFVVAGIVGAIVAFIAMDWVIIVLAGLAGAAATVTGLQLDNPAASIAYVVVAAAGIFVQARALRRPTAPADAA